MTNATNERDPRPRVLAQFARFGAVGAVGVGVNLLVFNALRLSVFSPDVVAEGPLIASACATLVAIATNWFGNRYWAFGGERHGNTLREAAQFVAVSLAALAIPIACLWVSHYVLGLTSLLADNVASNVVGLAFGALFRFALYRWWVFAPRDASGDPKPLSDLSAPTPTAVAAPQESSGCSP